MIQLATSPDQDMVFIDAYVSNGEDAVAACATAGIGSPEFPVTYVAKIMLERKEIVAAIEIRKKMRIIGQPEITRESIMNDMEIVFNRATQTNDLKGAIAAKRLQAELARFLDANVTVTHIHEAKQLTEKQLLAIINSKSIEGEFTEVETQETTLGQLPAR